MYWETRHDELATLIKEHRGAILATEDFQRSKDMVDFDRRAPDILSTLFDTVQRTFEELERFGFSSPTAG